MIVAKGSGRIYQKKLKKLLNVNTTIYNQICFVIGEKKEQKQFNKEKDFTKYQYRHLQSYSFCYKEKGSERPYQRKSKNLPNVIATISIIFGLL